LKHWCTKGKPLQTPASLDDTRQDFFQEKYPARLWEFLIYKLLHRWITHDNAPSKRNIQQGYGSSRFTMAYLISFRKLGLIELPTGFQMVAAPMKPKAPMNKKANAAIAAPTIVLVSKIFTLPKKKKSMRVYSTPTFSSPRRAKQTLPMATEHEGTSFHSIHNNPFQKQHTSILVNIYHYHHPS
jgi:hypothetical protein